MRLFVWPSVAATAKQLRDLANNFRLFYISSNIK
jgi:hypothetical protein